VVRDTDADRLVAEASLDARRTVRVLERRNASRRIIPSCRRFPRPMTLNA
jgi:hypothetical protein